MNLGVYRKNHLLHNLEFISVVGPPRATPIIHADGVQVILVANRIGAYLPCFLVSPIFSAIAR